MKRNSSTACAISHSRVFKFGVDYFSVNNLVIKMVSVIKYGVNQLVFKVGSMIYVRGETAGLQI